MAASETSTSGNAFRGRAIERLAPGIALCALVALTAWGLQSLEARLLGRAWLEALVLAILLGTAVRTFWTPGDRWCPGIAFSAKFVLEIAVALLGVTVSGAAILAAGPALLGGIVLVVCLAIPLSYGLGRLFGLPRRMAALVACGNAICGNSAIAAVAPVIDADGADVAAAIAFTAGLGVAVVLGLPLLGLALHLRASGFGVLAGLTVYAVPQVLAATAPMGSGSTQIGTLVKLVRVLMLGPVVLILSLVASRRPAADGLAAGPDVTVSKRELPKLSQLVPWFILAFLSLVAARSAHLIPREAIAPAGGVATGLTIVSMAALGLAVDVWALWRAGPKVASVVTLSLLALGAVALTLVYALGLN